MKSANGIPGFSQDQLEPDLRDLLLAPCDAYVEDGLERGKTVSIVYTWTKVGGQSKRQRFEYKEKFAPRCSSCIVLQVGVDDAAYLQ